MPKSNAYLDKLVSANITKVISTMISKHELYTPEQVDSLLADSQSALKMSMIVSMDESGIDRDTIIKVLDTYAMAIQEYRELADGADNDYAFDKLRQAVDKILNSEDMDC